MSWLWSKWVTRLQEVHMKRYLAELIGTFVLVFGGCGAAVLAGGKIEAKYAPGYIVAQIAGGIIAAGVLLIVAGGTSAGYDPSAAGFAANGYGAHSPGGYNLIAAFVAEVVLTFFLVFTVLGSTDVRAPVGFAGIPIGIVLVLIHLVGIPVTNTSVNRARSIGPALFVGGWALGQLWLFIVAPLIGA